MTKVTRPFLLVCKYGGQPRSILTVSFSLVKFASLWTRYQREMSADLNRADIADWTR